MIRQSVYIIIPVYNRKDITLTCLANLQAYGDLQQYHVIVVDDGSIDGTTQAIDHLYPDVTVLAGDGNLWWTGAIAKGMEYAYKQGAEYFIWLNDDCIPEPEALPSLVKFLQTHIDTIAAATSYASESGTPLENGCRGRKRFSAKPSEVVFVDSLSGYCVGIPASVYRSIGLPDAKKFPHYSGDDMYTLKATRSGFKVCILGNARVALLGVRDPEHDFLSYVESRAASNLSLNSVFFSKKSRYYLPTQLSYHMEKYHSYLGILLFLAKLIVWLLKYVQLRWSRLHSKATEWKHNEPENNLCES